ncbi:hypothetical protein G3I24_08270, partial [Micromonospora aurantiaca]|nr:hypothetical protein [Micromonospora aurantiaca]
RPVDLTGLADHITQQAPALPDPALEQAACAHAAFLTDLGAEHDLLIRQVLIVITGDIPSSAPASVPVWRQHRRRRVR